MPRFQWLLVFILLGFLPGSPTLAQTLTDPGTLRFAHTLESRRADGLESSRQDAAAHLVAVSEKIISLPGGSGSRKTELLGDAQYLTDSIALLDQQIEEVAPTVREARLSLISALEAQVTTLHQTAEDADPQRRPALQARIRDLETELGGLRNLEDPAAAVDPLSSATLTLSTLARVVAEERARLRTLQVLQDELRLFMGNLRLFDETGMPPSVRAEAGGDADPGCAISACSADLPTSPADLPFGEHFRPEGGSDGEPVGAMPITLGSLARLQEQLAALTDSPQWLPAEDLGWDDGTVTRETVLGAGLLSFRGQEEGRSGLGLKAGTSFFFSRALGRSTQLTVEPWLGARGPVSPASSRLRRRGGWRGSGNSGGFFRQSAPPLASDVVAERPVPLRPATPACLPGAWANRGRPGRPLGYSPSLPVESGGRRRRGHGPL